MEILKNININTEVFFLSNKSNPEKSLYFFMYKIFIVNNTDKTIQLINRHWDISDSNGNTSSIDGEGVVGEQPIMKPSDSFQYNSFCPIKTEFGTMGGFYTFEEQETGVLYKGIIPEFALVIPNCIN